MILLGIDPGLAILGYGVIRAEGSKLSPIDYGTVRTTPKEAFPMRLEQLYNGVKQLIKRFEPAEVIFEELFFSRNTATAMQVGAARAAALLAAQQAALPLFEYTPMQVKLAVTGNGHAEKIQMQQMVKLLLNLKELPKPDDAADALGIAICHANTGAHRQSEFRIK